MGIKGLNNEDASFLNQYWRSGTDASGAGFIPYTNPGEWTRILNQPGSPAAAGAYVPGTIDTSGYRALLIFGISGGGGGGANGNDNGAGGGGGGAVCLGDVFDVTDIDQVTYQVPGGGAGGVGDAHGPPTGWPSRQSGSASPNCNLGEPTDVSNLFSLGGAGGGTGGYVGGGGGNSGGSGGANSGSHANTTTGGSGGRRYACDSPPDGGTNGDDPADPVAAGAGGGAGGSHCAPSAY